MTNSRIILVGPGAAGLFASCFGSAPDNGAREHDMMIPACAWPAAADTFNADTGEGCSPKSMFQICQVPSGSTVHADGSITTPDGGTVVCLARRGGWTKSSPQTSFHSFLAERQSHRHARSAPDA